MRRGVPRRQRRAHPRARRRDGAARPHQGARGGAVPRLDPGEPPALGPRAGPAVLRRGRPRRTPRWTSTCPRRTRGPGRDLLAAAMAPPNFPITPEGLQGTWTFTALEAGYHTIAGFRVRATEVKHKGGRTFGYRVSDDTWLDRVPARPHHLHGCEQRGAATSSTTSTCCCTTRSSSRRSARLSDAYGHSTVDDAIELARGVRRAQARARSTTGRRAPTTPSTRIAVEHADRTWVSFARQGDVVPVGRPA